MPKENTKSAQIVLSRNLSFFVSIAQLASCEGLLDFCWLCLHCNFYQLQGLEGGQIFPPFAWNWSDCEERKKGIQEGEICLQSFRNNPLCSIPDAAAPSNKYLRLKKKIQSGANIILKWNTYKDETGSLDLDPFVKFRYRMSQKKCPLASLLW